MGVLKVLALLSVGTVCVLNEEASAVPTSFDDGQDMIDESAEEPVEGGDVDAASHNEDAITGDSADEVAAASQASTVAMAPPALPEETQAEEKSTGKARLAPAMSNPEDDVRSVFTFPASEEEAKATVRIASETTPTSPLASPTGAETKGVEAKEAVKNSHSPTVAAGPSSVQATDANSVGEGNHVSGAPTSPVQADVSRNSNVVASSPAPSTTSPNGPTAAGDVTTTPAPTTSNPGPSGSGAAAPVPSVATAAVAAVLGAAAMLMTR